MSLATEYKSTIRPALLKELGINNLHAVPVIKKIVLNVGFGSMRQVTKIIEIITNDLTRITGQKPSIRQARKAIAGFKLRQGEPVGITVTLRGKRMFDFLERLIKTGLPRIRDFRGLPLDGLDDSGNYSFGIKEHTVFPEIEHDNVTQFYGIGITIVTTAKDKKLAETLLREIGLPLKPHTDRRN